MKIFITLDYELYLGSKTGTVQKCLLEPTSALLKVLDKYNVKATFFVDAAYLLRMYQLKEDNRCLQEDYRLVSGHISALAEKGHSIQMHFHPQWLFSTHDGHDWIMDFQHYKMDDVELPFCRQSFKEAFILLQSLTDNAIKSFRAGGYSLMNFERYSDLFTNLGIENDTSVLRGRKTDTQYQKYDYTDTPKLTHYRFTSSNVIPDDDGSFMEYPIATRTTRGLVTTLRELFLNKLSANNSSMKRRWGDGDSIGDIVNKDRFGYIKRNVKAAMSSSVEVASIDRFGSSLNFVFKYTRRHFKGDDFVIIGHPKNITPWSLQRLQVFIEKRKNDIFKVL